MLISINLTKNNAMLHGEKTMVFTLFPPERFDVVESSPAAEPTSSGRGWTMHLTSDDGTFLFRARMRNFEGARLDHIIDSSIAGLLAVSAGGIVAAWLELAKLRPRSKETS